MKCWILSLYILTSDLIVEFIFSYFRPQQGLTCFSFNILMLFYNTETFSIDIGTLNNTKVANVYNKEGTEIVKKMYKIIIVAISYSSQ